MTQLNERAMLVTLSISKWTARRLDRRVTDETNAAHGAARDAGNYNKTLVPPKALAEIKTAESAARAEHYARTLPWLDDGARILSTAGYLDYTKAIAQCRTDFNEASVRFINQYPILKDEARMRLNGMFKDSDYPSQERLRQSFGFDVVVFPLPDAGDFRANLDHDQISAIQADIAQETQKAHDRAVMDVWQRIAETVGHMSGKLAAFKPRVGSKKAEGIFRDSLVTNVQTLADLLPSLNISDNPQLTEITNRMQTALTQHDAETLRESSDARQQVQREAAKIVQEVSDFIA